MSNDYAREVLRRTVAQTCQTIGWQGINSTPMDILVHVVEKYILTLGTQAHRYAEHFNRTEPNLDDLGLVFKDLHINLPELREYTKCVHPVPCSLNVPKFPLPKESHLNFLKPGSQEVVTRPVHVHEYLPAMYPEKEKETTPPVADTVEIVQNGTEEHDHANTDCHSPEISVTDISEKPRDVFKRPTDPVSTPSSIKKARLKLEEEDCHTREISSVMMTMSGFLSPAREGKLPEAKTPHVIPDVVHQEKIKTPHLNPLAHMTNPLVNRIEKKLKKNKVPNGKIEKASKRKEKSHKNPLAKQKNSENKVNKSAMRLADNRHNKLAMHLARGKVRPSGSNKHQHQHQHHPNEMPHLKQLPPSVVNNMKPIKQEIHFKNSREVASTFDPRPPSIPKIHKHPLVPQYVSNSNEEPLLPPNVVIKEERVEAEKLTSQPDRSKLNIFKKISPKIKEERHDPHDKYSHDNGAVKFEKGSSHLSPGFSMEEADHHRRKVPSITDLRNHAAPIPNAVDLSSKPTLNVNEVINIDDDSNDGRRHYIKSEPVDESPKDLSKPKSSSSIKMSTVPIMKEKKERKRKERKPKPDKAMKEFSKMLKESKMQMMKDASRLSGFPMIPPGLVPGPGMIPNPGLIPGGGLFSRLNPALRGMLPNDNFLPNPFCMDPSRLPNPAGFLPAGPGLIPPGPLITHLTHGFGQPPRMPQHPNLPPFLRRPSLEVIPLDEMDDPHPRSSVAHNSGFSFVPPPLTIKEKDKHEKHKSSPKENFMLNSGISVTTSPTKQSSPKPNPIIQMPPVKPDITIKLNPPDKQKVIEPKIEPLVIEEPSVVIHTKEKEKDKSERKKDKLHKKDKKDKEQKIKKKKDKKEKLKLKLEKKKEKEERHDSKERLKKEKKEKRKDKEKTPIAIATPIPKLTLKLGPSSPMLPPSPDNPRRLNIKPIVKKDEAIVTITEKLDDTEEMLSVERSQSPELARISALVTRPPKIKSASKHHPPIKTEVTSDINTSSSPPPQSSNSPTRKNRPPSTFSKYKRIYFKPIPKRTGFDDSITDPDVEEVPVPPGEVVNIQDNIPNVPLGTPFYMDPHGNKVWICPACGRPDNGSPMIGCDGCDGWYHWICVGIRIAPDDSEDWYCTSCHAKRAAMASAMAGGGGQTGKKRGRKPKLEKLKEN